MAGAHRALDGRHRRRGRRRAAARRQPQGAVHVRAAGAAVVAARRSASGRAARRAAPRPVHARLVIARNGSVTERLWRLVTHEGAHRAPSWLFDVPAHVWEIVRDTVLRCSMKVYIIGAGPGRSRAHHGQGRAARRALPGRPLHRLARARGGDRARAQGCARPRQLGHDARRDRRRCSSPRATPAQDVARVHTGDPSVFGSTAEQMRRLDALGIDYEIVPGVSSFAAAAAAHRQGADAARAVPDGDPDARRGAHADAARREARPIWRATRPRCACSCRSR